MITREIQLPELGMIAGTRVMLGVGLGLLMAGHIAPPQRRAVGKTLLTVGILTTIPLALGVLFGNRPPQRQNRRLREEAPVESMSGAL